MILGDLVCMALKGLDIMVGAAMAGILIILTTTLVCVLPAGQTAGRPPIVTTPSGRYQGIVKTLTNSSSVIRYAGIPFAEPPVGERRFKRPEPIQRRLSDEVIDAGKIKKSCWSITKKINNPYYSEDCLYLNIYVPGAARDSNDTSYSVMVWIHGGGFVAGGIFPEPWSFVARGQVIVVTTNYRLGVFGFLTTEDDNLPANNGLWDQAVAMEWVKENIHHFGGDPNSITVFGESAGAMSAALHAVSPISSHFFNKAIFQSGAASSLLARNPTKNAAQFGFSVNCTLENDTQKFASCLRNVSVEAILDFSRLFDGSTAQRQLDFTWMPTVDGCLIPDDPVKLLQNKTYLASIGAFDRDYLFGCNNNEGSLLVDNFLNSVSRSTVENVTFFEDLVDYILSMRYGIPSGKLAGISQAVISFYTGVPISERPFQETVKDFMADGIFYAPAVSMALSFSHCYNDISPICFPNRTHVTREPECKNETGRSFLYFFDYCPPVQKYDCREKCMTHGLDVSYEFPKRNFEDDTQQKLSNSFIDMLTTFAKTSSPGFPPFDHRSQHYLSFSPFPGVRQFLHHHRINLWTKTIPSLMGAEQEQILANTTYRRRPSRHSVNREITL